MIVGVTRQIKQDEYRVGLLPVGVEQLARAGHRLLADAADRLVGRDAPSQRPAAPGPAGWASAPSEPRAAGFARQPPPPPTIEFITRKTGKVCSLGFGPVADAGRSYVEP